MPIKPTSCEQGQIDFSKADFLDLVLILRDLWPHFQPLFSGSSERAIERGEITKPLFEINDMRKYLVHPQKARKHGQAISSQDVDQLRRALKLIQPASAAAHATPG